MQCSISGEVPVDAVCSRKSGHVFERRLVEKHIEANGVCPITGEPLGLDDLVALRGPVGGSKPSVPRSTQTTSIPAMLQQFQSEWDALVLETHQLKKQLASTRRELSNALYQHDAACRVIARLLDERDQAREQLATVSANGASSASSAAAHTSSAMDTEAESGDEPTTLNEHVLKRFTETSTTLSQTRRKRKLPEGLAKETQIASYACRASHNVHKASAVGVRCVALPPALHTDSPDDTRVLSGGVDKTVIVSDRATGKVVGKGTGHTKPVNDVQFHVSEDVLFSCSDDKTVRVWKPSGGRGHAYQAAWVIAGHQREVVSIGQHPTVDYVLSASLDGTFAVHDIVTQQTLATVRNNTLNAGFTSMRVHPDGLILGTGTTDSYVRIWDLKSQQNVATFEGHQGKVKSLAFSENGYYMASGGEGGTVKLWDLRKLRDFQTINVGGTEGVLGLAFDHSGKYLATAAADVRVFIAKTAKPVVTYADHTATVTGVAWGPLASFVVSSSMDRSIKVFEA